MAGKDKRWLKPVVYVSTVAIAAAITAGSLAFKFPERPNFIKYTADVNQEETIIISGAGDVTLGSGFNNKFQQIESISGLEAAFDYPFQNVKKYFSEDDLTIVNFEGTLTNYDNKRPKEFNFKGDPKYAECLNYGSVEIANLANNHFMDYYSQGAVDTIDSLVSKNINYCGGGKNFNDASQIKVLNINGIIVAYLGFAQVGMNPQAAENDAGTLPYNESFVYEMIKKADEISEIVVVSCHWGVERIYSPTEFQKNSGHKMIDAGADIIFGHHPHVLEGIEKYGEGIIFYSLGNFAFGGNTYPKDRDSMIAQVICSKNGIQDYRIIPVVTHPAPREYQPFVPEDTSSIESKIMKVSSQFNFGEIKFYK